MARAGADSTGRSPTPREAEVVFERSPTKSAATSCCCSRTPAPSCRPATSRSASPQLADDDTPPPRARGGGLVAVRREAAAASTGSSATASSASSVAGLRSSNRPAANAPGVHPVLDRTRQGASCEHRSQAFPRDRRGRRSRRRPPRSTAKLLGTDGNRHPGARHYFDCGGVILAVLDLAQGGLHADAGPEIAVLRGRRHRRRPRRAPPISARSRRTRCTARRPAK